MAIANPFYALYGAGTTACTTYITNNNWIRYIDAQPQVPALKEEYTATLVTDDDEDA